MDGSCGVGQMGSAAAQGRGGEGRVGATNIGRLRCSARQGKVRGGVTSWHLRVFAVVVGAMGCLLLAASLMMSAVHQVQFRNGAISRNIRGLQLKENIVRKEQAEQIMHGRLLHMATSVVTKNKSDGENFALWEEPYKQARKWKPCAAKHSYPDEGPSENNNGFILVSANGGLNQQRVAVCNAVVVAALLNATLALPRFLYSSVWKDKSQFGDIYQEDYFVNYMKSDVHIVKDLPPHLQSLDLEAIGSQITDMDIMKEAEPFELIKSVLPILWENGIVHFLGFGNRLGFDSVPIHLQDCFAGTSTIFGRFSYKEMKKATRNFSTASGSGENGTIFKGQLSDGSVVAIRRIESSPKQGQLEFCKEMELLGRLHHRHLVALKGFCLTRFERFQVYEYMENGSLKDHLHCNISCFILILRLILHYLLNYVQKSILLFAASGKLLLPWKNRIQIAIDVANALEYLHFYCDPPLYHGDLKPSNVLLDRNYLAKLAGCGIAHCSSGANTTVSSTPVNVKIQATPGYVDPEYVVTQELTPKSDVYSYGVLLLELVTGKPVVQDDKSMVEWSRELIGSDYRLHELVDPAVADAFDLDELQVMADVIHWCTHRDGGARPSMKQVLRILYERLDPLSGRFARAVEGEEGYYYGGGQSGRKGKVGEQQLHRGGDVIQFSGEARCLPSSSSTSRSYCSRSVALDCNSPEPPQSPHGHGAFLV